MTIPITDDLEQALKARAEAQGKTIPEIALEILSETMAERPLSAKVGHLKGRLNLPQQDGSWREQLRARNWRT